MVTAVAVTTRSLTGCRHFATRVRQLEKARQVVPRNNRGRHVARPGRRSLSTGSGSGSGSGSGLQHGWQQGRPQGPEMDKWRQAKIVAGYAAVVCGGLYIYSRMSVRSPPSVASDLVEKAATLEIDMQSASTEGQRARAMRKAEDAYVSAISRLDEALIQRKSSSKDYHEDTKKSESNNETDKDDDNDDAQRWLTESLTARWYPSVPVGFQLPDSGSEEGPMLVRALAGLAQLKRRTGENSIAIQTQLRLVATLRSYRGMHALPTIEATRELAHMYKTNQPPYLGDAAGVLKRALELADTSRSLRGQTAVELRSALAEDLSLVYQELGKYHLAARYAERAVRALEKGEGGRTDPRCGVMWTNITSYWTKIGSSALQSQVQVQVRTEAALQANDDSTSLQKYAEEVTFAAKEAERVASSTAPAYTEHFSPSSWQCAAHSNYISVMLAKGKVNRAERHLAKAMEVCPNLEEQYMFDDNSVSMHTPRELEFMRTGRLAAKERIAKKDDSDNDVAAIGTETDSEPHRKQLVKEEHSLDDHTPAATLAHGEM